MTEPVASRTPVVPIAPPTSAICPYLLSSDGGWRASTPSRDHRCTAVAPAAILASEKQRRLCLVDEHRSCSTYQAATRQSADDASPHASPARATTRRVTRTTPVVLDQGRWSIALPSLPQRGAAQGGLVALMAVAFGALVIARPSAGGPAQQPTVVNGASTGPSVGTGADPTAAPSIDPTATPAASPDRTLVPSEVEPTARPASSAVPTAAGPTSYTIQRGDTLSGVAGQFGTTWQVLAELNGIADPGRLRVGQVIQLP